MSVINKNEGFAAVCFDSRKIMEAANILVNTTMAATKLLNQGTNDDLFSDRMHHVVAMGALFLELVIKASENHPESGDGLMDLAAHVAKHRLGICDCGKQDAHVPPVNQTVPKAVQ